MSTLQAELDAIKLELDRLAEANAVLRARRNDTHVAQAKSKRDYFAGKPCMTKLEQAQAELDLAEVERELSANNWDIERLSKRAKEIRVELEAL